MVELKDAILHYKKRDVQEAILVQAKNKEIVGSYNGQGYAKRPDILQYPADVYALVKQGITSFHASEEIWSNPLTLDLKLSKEEMTRLRVGWDLVLDIDCPDWKFSQIAADYLVKALQYKGIKSVSIKFSGNHGFHIGVPFEAFPTDINGVPTRTLFPEAPRKIAMYLKDITLPHLKQKMLELYTIDEIAKRSKKTVEELTPFDPFNVLGIDTILISSRHLYRMCYSFNEKSGLLSVPVKLDKIMDFTLDFAKAENVVVDKNFLDRSNVDPGEARQLFIAAYDHKPKIIEDTDKKAENTFEELKDAIPENFFPDCMRKLLAGIGDGKKRGVFILINFFRSAGYNKDQVEQMLYDWNKKNKEPLREVYIKGQLRHAFDKAPILPPNCSNENYYKDLGIACSECKHKNPISSAKRRLYFATKKEEEKEKTKRETLTDEQKEIRKRFRENQKINSM